VIQPKRLPGINAISAHVLRRCSLTQKHEFRKEIAKWLPPPHIQILVFGACAAMCSVDASASTPKGPPPLDPLVAPDYFEDISLAEECGQWVKHPLVIDANDAHCPCRRFTPTFGGCDLLHVAVTDHPIESENGDYWRIRIQHCEDNDVTISDDFTIAAHKMGAFKVMSTSGVYQNPVPAYTWVFCCGDGGGPVKFPSDPMACCPSCFGDSELVGGVCHLNGKLTRKVTYHAPPQGEPDTHSRSMQIRASATIKLDARLNRLGCDGTGSATVSGRAEASINQELTFQNVGMDRKFPAVIAGERTFDFSGATTSGSSGFKLKLGVNPEVEVGFTSSGTSPADGNLRIIAKSELVDWESRRFCKAPPALPPGISHMDYLLEMTGDVNSRALLATGRESECKTQVHLHNIDVSFGECAFCAASGEPNPSSHNP
jgi:hypothetical protein